MEKYKNLLEKGCCNFQITDSKILRSLEQISKSEHFESKNWKFLSWCHWGIEFLNHEEAIDFIQEYKDLREPSQVYFQKPIDKCENVYTKTISDEIKNYVSEAYGLNKSEIEQPGIQLNIYLNGFHIRNHRDGGDGGQTRISAVLIYMNECEGGELVIHGGEETITPKLGRVVMIDLTKHDIEHAVNLIKGDNPRIVLVSFVNKS